jgi:hypothetical protein
MLSPDPPAAWRRLNPSALLEGLRARLVSGLLIVGGCVLLGILYLQLVPHRYTAELLVVAADDPLSSLPSAMSGLGALVGMDLKQNNLPFIMYADAMASRPVAEAIVRDPRIMHTIFPDEWDAAAGRWHEPASILYYLLKGAKMAAGLPAAWHPPGPERVQRYVEKRVQVSEEKRRPVIRIGFAHKDRLFAAYFISKVSMEADGFLRRQSIARTSAYIAYLEKRLRDVTVAEQRQSLAQLISTYEKSRMMASSDAAFAGDRFGGVTVPSQPDIPNPALVLAVAVVAGLMLWFLLTVLILMRDQRDRTGPPPVD